LDPPHPRFLAAGTGAVDVDVDALSTPGSPRLGRLTAGDWRMASAKPLQPGSWRAHLYLVREVGIDYLAELTGCARDGVALQLEEAAPAAGVQPGDLLLVITKDDRIEKMARLRDGLKHPDVDQARRKADGYTCHALQR
jgi:hypothetical protein